MVSFSVTPEQGDTNTTFTADMSGTYDPDGDSLTYEIDWGDGSTSVGPRAEHSYGQAGDYVVTGTATDSFGVAASNERAIRVCSAMIEGACVAPPPDTATVVPDLCNEAPDVCIQDSIVPGDALGDTGDAVFDAVPSTRTSSQRVLIVSANVRQFYADSINEERRRNFAKRINALKNKPRGDADGYGTIPDIILLQESSYASAEDITTKLKNKTGFTFLIANKKSDYSVQDTDEINREADTVILYNKRTMEKATGLGGAHYDAEYTQAQKSVCADEPELVGIDADLDGLADCAEKRKFMRQFMYSFVELKAGQQEDCANPPCGTGFRVAVAATHLVTGEHLARAHRESLKRTWSSDIVNKLRRKYSPSMDAYVVGGDFNIHRCRNKPSSDPPDPATDSYDYPNTQGASCDTSESPNQDNWWATMTGARSYTETVYERNSAAGDRLHAQYKDGCDQLLNNNGDCDDDRFGFKRIDFIFARGVPVVAASRDLTCGETAGTGNIRPHCDRGSNNPQRYSDHRLLWALIGG